MEDMGMSIMNNTAPPIYDANMMEPFLKSFIEVREIADKEFAKYGNDMGKYTKAKREEIQNALLELDID